MFKIDGIEEVIAAIYGFIDELQANLAADLGVLGQDALSQLRIRTSQEFQTVPTYLYEGNVLKLPGYKSFDTNVGFFSIDAAPVEGTVWEGMVQLHLNGPHLLNELLDTDTTITDNAVEVAVGYPEGTGEGNTKYITQTLFGTEKEQPRPFLNVILNDFADDFARIAEESGRRTINGG